MDFFAAQDEARRKTGWLLWLFLLCVIGVVAAVSLLSWGLGILLNGTPLPLGTVLMVAAGTALLVLLSSGYKAMSLRGGGGVVARDLGGRLLDPSTVETSERKLLNVVEEMAIASGVPVPQVYVMDAEEGINAFAAGTEPGNAAIGVTRGCMMRLSRAELQGVIAHEFSHILNGDMKLNMRLIGWIFGLVVLSIMGRGLMESLRFVRVGGGRSDRDNGGGAILIAILAVGIGLMIIGGIGVFFARLLQAGVSRQREFLADASAVQFTREPEGLAGALKKIGGKGSRIEASKASEASHCFFADGGLFAFGLATHPPLELRIKRIQKSWDGEFAQSQLPPIIHQESGGDARVSGLAGASSAAAVELGAERDIDVAHGVRIRAELPTKWREAVHDRAEAQALVFGLLLAQDEELLREEVIYLRDNAGTEAAKLAVSWQEELGASHSSRKIALMDMAIPTLRNLSREEYGRFLGITRRLIGSDGRVDLFEYMLQRLIEHHLESHFRHQGPSRIRYRNLSELAAERSLLISAFANLNPDPQGAFLLGVGNGGGADSLVPPGQISLKEINLALEKLELAAPPVKRDVLQGCARAIGSDGVLSSREAELLRAMADGIGCSIPPGVEDLQHRD